MVAGFTEKELIDGSNDQQKTNPSTEGADTIDDYNTMMIGINLYKKFGKHTDDLNFKHVLDALDKLPVEGNFKYSKQIHWCYNPYNKNKVR
ncbi:polymorphic toxin type 44 domain-containing protein [Psychrobacter sp. ENNN9_III]